MSLQMVIGRAGSGKTSLILNDIRQKLLENPSGPPILLIVPEQATFQLERQIAAVEGLKGTVRVQVLGFKRLALRIMQETGGAALIPITEEGKKMLLYRVMRKLQPELKLYANASGGLGLIERLCQLYGETKRYGSNMDEFARFGMFLESSEKESPLLKDKMHDLLLLFREFEQELSGLYVDAEDHVTKLAEGVPQSAYVQGAEIWIDGFDSFTPQELQAIQKLMETAVSVKVALTLDKPYDLGQRPNELNLFYETGMAYLNLQSLAESSGIAVLPPVVLDSAAWNRGSETLAVLESLYGTRTRRRKGEEPTDLGQSLQLKAGASKRAEAEAAAREMIRLTRDEGARWRDMAVYVRSIEDYADILEPVLQSHGIPYFLDQRKSVARHPLIRLVRGALDVVRRFWKYEDVFRCVKTGFLQPLDGSITREDMDLLENYVLASGIEGARWNSEKAWQGAPSLSLELNQQGTEPAGQTLAHQERMNVILRCRQAVLNPLSAFEKRMKKAHTAGEMCRAVFQLLEDTESANRLDLLAHQEAVAGRPQQAMEHRSLWGALLDLLDQIVDMMGEEKLAPDLFAGVLDTGLQDLRLGLVPPSLDQVLIGSTDRTRTGQVPYAFLLGVNEGVMPSLFQEEGVLTDNERNRLTEIGLKLAPGLSRKLLNERFLIYRALSAGGRYLWVSYPVSDESGGALLPSEVIRDLKLMFPSLVEAFIPDLPAALSPDASQLERIAGPNPALSGLIGILRQWRAGAELSPVWQETLGWFRQRHEYADRLQFLFRSLDYRNETRNLSRETSRKLYGTRLRTSVSRMESFAACPFSHFASHGLRLKERQLYRLQAPDIGQLFHAALSMMAVSFRNENRSWGSLTAEECMKEADKAVDKLAPKLQGEILLSTKRYSFITRKLKNIVGRASVILGEQAKRGSFEPVGLEVDFGPGKELPPLVFELENGCVMEIVGRIDRVDAAEGEQGILLRVIDYKSSLTDLKLHEVYYGLALQMLTYLDVILSSSEEWLGLQALPAGTLYFHVHNPLLQSTNGLTEEQARAEMLRRFKLRGLITADLEVTSLMDNQLEKGYSDILPVAVKADGGFYSSASVATPEQWNLLLSSVRKAIRGIGTRITEGDVAIEPYRLGQETPCTFCSYRSVCQIDPSDEARFKVLGKPGKGEMWNRLEEELQ